MDPTIPLELYPEQALALDNINASWRIKEMVSCIVGMRGGKTHVMNEMIRRMGMDSRIIIVAPTIEQARYNYYYEGSEQAKNVFFMSYQSLTGAMQRMEAERKLFPYSDCAFFFIDHEWVTVGHKLIDDVLEYTHRIVAFSSPGPNSDELIGAMEIEAATWDWNISLKPEDFFTHFKNDFYKTARDTGLYLSRNMLTEQVICERFEPEKM